uniref:Uncharacterized protein n=1 Tax=Coccolithus braarudii TaxID=221442 RepID=A0A7S0LP38_9EUKA|mmetsp:Transcript_46820/g.99900  ORF Transcript_46820/g.99900 Transcript_46820/m.99900 type:complete len:115 (+) Transcript_46820:478-822(+)
MSAKPASERELKRAQERHAAAERLEAVPAGIGATAQGRIAAFQQGTHKGDGARQAVERGVRLALEPIAKLAKKGREHQVAAFIGGVHAILLHVGCSAGQISCWERRGQAWTRRS